MLHRTLTIAFLLTSPALAGEETVYIMPEIPTEAMKIEALKLGYIANGFSMVGTGSIDVSGAFKIFPPPIAPPDPPSPDKSAKRRR